MKIPKNEYVLGLIKRAKEERKKKEAEALKIEQERAEELKGLIEKEDKLREKIETETKRIEKMENQYAQLEEKLLKKSLEKIKSSELTKEDLKAGKISVNQFLQKGKTDEKINQEAEIKTQKELEAISDAIREKKAEMIKTEVELYEAQESIFYLLVYPGRTLMEKYKELSEWLGREISAVTEAGPSIQGKKMQKQDELRLLNESSLGSGHYWRGITKAEARRLIHNPIIQKKYIPSLLQQLDESVGEEDSLVDVVYYVPRSYRPGSVEVHRSFQSGGKKIIVTK